jgi:hypothetical protein
MSKNINDLRDALFAQLDRLNGDVSADELERAKAVASIAKEINASAKIEVDHMRVTGNDGGSEFLPTDTRPRLPKPAMRMIDNTQRRPA